MNRCPSPVELERAYWTPAVATLRVHAAGCARCSAELAEIEALVAAGRAIEPTPASPERREEIRTTILAAQSRTAAPERRAIRWWHLAPVAAAAATALLVWFLWPRGESGPVASVRRGTVMVHGDARYMLMGPQPDEIVRLVDGTLTVQVEPLAKGERFRVITSDGEVEVVGTAFDVTAASDRLIGVRVLHGVVHVRDGAGQIHVLQAGAAWQLPRESAPVPPPPPEPELAPGPVGPRPPVERAPVRQMQSQAPPPAAPPARGEAQKAFDDGWNALRAERFDEAAGAFARSLSSGAGSKLAEDASYWQSVALARAGQATRAARSFESFLTAYPRSTRAGEASAALGWILFDARDYRGAARRFRAAIQDPSARVRRSATDGLNALRQAGQ